MKKLVIALAAVSTMAHALDTTTHYRPEQYLAMSNADKALVVTDTRSTALNNRTVINSNHDQAMDASYDNYRRIEAQGAQVGQNMYGIIRNRRTIGGVRSDTDHNRHLIDNIQTGQDTNSFKIEELESRVDSGVALSSAFAALPRAYRGGSVVGFGLGHFNGVSAVAVGAEHSTGDWSFNGGVSAAEGKARSEYALKAGVGYHF